MEHAGVADLFRTVTSAPFLAASSAASPPTVPPPMTQTSAIEKFDLWDGYNGLGVWPAYASGCRR